MTTRNTNRDTRQAVPDTPVFEGTDVPVETLFDHLERRLSLPVFLKDNPTVTRQQALEALDARLRREAQRLVDSALPYVSGTPRFVGTRVFITNLTDYLAGGHSLEEFLEDFPSVTREQAVEVIELAGRLLESAAYENSTG